MTGSAVSIVRVLSWLFVCAILLSVIFPLSLPSLADTSMDSDDTLSTGSTVTANSVSNQVSIPLVLGESKPLQLMENPWPMLGANPQRTSWTPEEVRGQLGPVWYRPIDPYINYKMQIIAANGLLYISTARGLYALEAEDGDVAWIYPTALPLGHSPTVVGDVLYVGGYDRKIHAINAIPNTATLPEQEGYKINNQVIWIFDQAEAGFETNPLVVEGKLYAGNRDEYFYALDATTGDLLWKYKTGGPILFSAAYKDGLIYFAANDGYAYALRAQAASAQDRLAWKSKKLPGAGFHSYWPVIYTAPQMQEEYVIFAGSEHHSDDISYSGVGAGFLGNNIDNDALYVDPFTGEHFADGKVVGSEGAEPGDWADGTVSIDAERITQYYEDNPNPDPSDLDKDRLYKPWRRTYFVLNRLTGKEFTFDSDGDGKPEYVPIAWYGTHSGNRYPPVIGSDGVLYQTNSYIADQYIPLGGVSGWKFGTEYISRVDMDRAVDEPLAYSTGGNLIYWSLCCDRSAGALDVTLPYGIGSRIWAYWSYDLGNVCPGLGSNTIYGGSSGVYGSVGNQNPPIPYRGMLYKIASNAVVALGSEGGSTALPTAPTVEYQDVMLNPSLTQLKQRLIAEIQRILDAGHLRPGYYSSLLGEMHLSGAYWSFLTHYFHNPGETYYTLARAIPYLPSDLQQQVRAYLQSEYTNYHQYTHIGWKTGAQREAFDTPPEIQDRMNTTGTSNPSVAYVSPDERSWDNAYRIYGIWKAAEVLGNASEAFSEIRGAYPNTQMTDAHLLAKPYTLNAYIAGYIGYLNLEKEATGGETPAVRTELNRLLKLRSDNFTKALSFGWEQPLNVAANFMYMTPELGEYLRQSVLPQVQEALDEYETIAPYWFVSKYDATKGEGTLQLLFDYNAIFQAKALILQEPYEELAKYIDVPAFAVGDLFYIQNLVSAIEAAEQTASSLALREGWNLISLPVAPVSSAITDTLSTIAGKYDQACVYNRSGATGTWVCYCPLDPTPDASQIVLDQTHGIWIHATQPVTLTMQGSPTDSASIPLRSGWNMVGYPSLSARPVQEALASIQGKYDLICAYDPLEVGEPWRIYQPDRLPVLNNLTQMIPGQGYWLKVNQDCVWVVPQ